jgi:cobaltochelatase CobS
MLLERIAPDIPQDIRETMVSFAGEVRRLFMGESEKQKYGETIDITFSTRTLIRWATLTRRFQPLARQGIQPIGYALDRALGFRASRETRAMLHELAQRMFPTAESQQTTDIENT